MIILTKRKCSLFTQEYPRVLSSRHLWKLIQISLLAEVNETFFGSFFWLFVCLLGFLQFVLAISADLNEENVSLLQIYLIFFSM